MLIVKVYRVFPSNCNIFASSQKGQFHKINIGDSKRVVKPIMQVRTYLTRNFATFRPSELQPPFTIE